jgi:hypothetical protein
VLSVVAILEKMNEVVDGSCRGTRSMVQGEWFLACRRPEIGCGNSNLFGAFAVAIGIDGVVLCSLVDFGFRIPLLLKMPPPSRMSTGARVETSYVLDVPGT